MLLVQRARPRVSHLLERYKRDVQIHKKLNLRGKFTFLDFLELAKAWSRETKMQVSVHEAKTNFAKLLEMVSRGERVIITRHGIPIAELVPARTGLFKLGILKNVVAPPPDDFFEPLGEDELRAWEGE